MPSASNTKYFSSRFNPTRGISGLQRKGEHLGNIGTERPALGQTAVRLPEALRAMDVSWPGFRAHVLSDEAASVHGITQCRGSNASW